MHMEDYFPDPKEERQLLQHWIGRGPFEDRNGDTESPPHSRNAVP